MTEYEKLTMALIEFREQYEAGVITLKQYTDNLHSLIAQANQEDKRLNEKPFYDFIKKH